jgi:hypothetical protein
MMIHMLTIYMMLLLSPTERLVNSDKMIRNLRFIKNLVLTVQQIYSKVFKGRTSQRDRSHLTLGGRCPCKSIIKNQIILYSTVPLKIRIRLLKLRDLMIENSRVSFSISFILLGGSILDVQNRNQLKNLIID